MTATSLPAGPKPGDYACVNINDRFFGRMIKLLTYPWNYKGTRYDHAFIYLGNGLIAEAQPRGAKISGLSKYAGMDITWSTDDLTNDQRQGITATAALLATVRIPYGFLDIFWLFLHLTLGLNWGWLMARVENLCNMICSQMVAFCGVYNGVSAWRCGMAHDQEVTPQMLAERC